MTENENERLILFSDAVIAITITLLVLDIRLPQDAGEMADAQLWSALLALWPRYFSYGLSFAVIGIFWAGHRQKFEHIRRSSPRLIWFNLLFLLGVGLMPFVTDLLAENAGSVATMVYAGLVAAISLISASMSAYAAWAGLMEPAADNARAWRWAVPSLCNALVFALSIPVAYVSADLGKYFWLLLIPAGMASARLTPRAARR